MELCQIIMSAQSHSATKYVLIVNIPIHLENLIMKLFNYATQLIYATVKQYQFDMIIPSSYISYTSKPCSNIDIN